MHKTVYSSKNLDTVWPCRVYLNCKNGKPTAMTCPNGTTLRERSGKCQTGKVFYQQTVNCIVTRLKQTCKNVLIPICFLKKLCHVKILQTQNVDQVGNVLTTVQYLFFKENEINFETILISATNK